MDKVSSLVEKMRTLKPYSYSTEKNSASRENSNRKYDCPVCQDRGVVVNIVEYTARVCHCQEQKRNERLFASSQITPAFRAKSFGNFTLTGRSPAVCRMLGAARSYAEQYHNLKDTPCNWLVLLGEPGCGKTHLSMAVANLLYVQKVQLLYFQHIEGINELKEAIREKGEDGIAEKLRSMKKIELLVWDDLFKTSSNDQPRKFDIEIAFETLNYRYLNLLPTIISSEHTPEQLLSIDKAIGSRIMERGKGHMEVVEGMNNNYRLE